MQYMLIDKFHRPSISAAETLSVAFINYLYIAALQQNIAFNENLQSGSICLISPLKGKCL